MKDNEILPVADFKTTLTQEQLKRLNIGKFSKSNLQDLHIDDGIKTIAVKYVDNIRTAVRKNYGLFFYGKNASGKSITAATILKACNEKGYSCYFTTVQELSQAFFAKQALMFDENQTVLERCTSCHVLAIDGLGTEHDAAYIQTRLESLIRERSLLKYGSTILSSRLSPVKPSPQTPSEFEQVYGANLQSLLDEVTFSVKFTGPSYRDRIQDEMKGLFGA